MLYFQILPSGHGMILRKRQGTPRRNRMEAAHPELTHMLKIIHLKGAVVGDSGEKFGDHMITQLREVLKALDQTDIRDNCCSMIRIPHFLIEL